MEESSNKKSPFDDLSKDELIKKCKAMLIIAQKAKQAKTDINNEYDAIKENCKKMEIQKVADKESLKTMQEYIGNLTAQNLQYATDIDTFKTQFKSHKSLIKDMQEELERNNSENKKKCALLENEMKNIREQLVTLDTENTSYKRQNNRLEDENEKLINQLDELEKQIDVLNRLGLEQQQHLLELEKNSQIGTHIDVEKIIQEFDNTKSSLEISLAEKRDLIEKCKSLNNEVEEKSLENVKINEEVESIKSSMEKIGNKLVANEAKLSEVEKLYDVEKAKKDKLNTRLKSYKEKLLKCNSSIDQLKKSKSVLLKTVTDYSESVPKWQNDILNASKLLSEQLLQLESENSDLKNKLSNMESNTNDSETNEKVNNLLNENILLGLKLNSLTDEIAQMKDENMNLKSRMKTLTIDYEQSCSNVKSLESEKIILVNEKKSAKDTIQKNENEKSNLKSMLEELNSNNARYKSEIQQLKNKIDSIEAEKHLMLDQMENTAKPKVIKATLEQTALQTLKDELISLRCGLVSTEEENKLLHESNENLKSQMEASAETQTTPEMRNLMEQNDMLQTDISKMHNKLMTYKNENSSLHAEVKECRQKLAEVENMSQDYESMKSKFSNYKSENAELLKEMKEINQVLKERGENISKQYMEINELNLKSQAMEEEIKKLKEGSEKKDEEIKKYSSVIKELDEEKEKNKALLIEMDNLESLLKERDGIIISLQDDIEKIKQNQGNISYDGQGDNLSVSTMSRVEESSRLKDLDDSFEERYSKLRMLAVKLRKRVNELTLENKNLEESSLKHEQEKTDMMNRLQQIESTTNKNMSVENEKMIAAEKKDTDPSNDKLNSLTKALEFSKMEKASLNMALKELNLQVSSLKASNEELRAKEAECLKFKDMLALKESKLALEESQHQITKDSLEKAKKEVKKKSVLSLEMEDYERSMKELTGKMEEDKKKIVQMESTIDTQQATISSLKTQIKMLEDQLNSEEKSLKEVKDLLNRATENAKESENVISIKNDILLKLEREIEDNKLQYEDLNLQLASALGSREKSIMTFEQEKSDLISKCKLNESRYNEIEEKLKFKSIELEELRTEFAGYKVRAQSVLRQNNKKDLSLEENLKEEMAALKAEIESLKTECENWKTELENVQSERCRLVNRCSELQSTITAAQSERESIAEQYSVLLQKEIQEQKNVKLQMTTLTQCYKKQITELEESTSDQIAKLKKELEFSRASIARVSISKDNNIDRKHLQFVAINSIPDIDDSKVSHELSENMNEINVSLLEREEGEGSESTPAPSPTSSNKIIRHNHRGKRDPMPLDQLLETGILEDGPECYSEGEIELRLNNALKQIEMRDKRLAHLTELVAEAEKEVARRSQLVETLKEEVRRCQRALDRGHHHHNQEYLKNVIIKFLTLNAGDERSCLVPVLNTILTLSPEETQQLNAAARGLDPNANRTWGSYLPWPGGR